MKIRGFLLTCVVLALLMLVAFKHDPKIEALATANNSAKTIATGSPVPSDNPPAQVTNTFTPVAIPTPADPDQSFDIFRMTNDVYRARVQRHFAIKGYQISPARDTDECQQIVKLLENEGLGLEAVRDAYNAAWDNKSKQAMIESAGPSGKADTADMVAIFREQSADKLRDAYGITNQAFFDALFNIKPKVFFGLRVMSVPPGERIE